MNISIQVIGWIATALTISMFLPQSIKTISTRNIKGLSKETYSIYILGASLWCLYSVLPLNNFWPGFATNFIVGIILIPMIWLLFKNKIKALILISIFLSISILGIILNVLQINVPFVLYLIFAIVAGTLTGLGFLPQLNSVIKNKGSKGFSNVAALINIASSILWALYFILLTIQGIDKNNDILVIAATIVSLFANVLLGSFNASILLLNKHYEKDLCTKPTIQVN